jgi:hypothetical protein
VVSEDVPLVGKRDEASYCQMMHRAASSASLITKEELGVVVVCEDEGEGHLAMARSPCFHPHCH